MIILSYFFAALGGILISQALPGNELHIAEMIGGIAAMSLSFDLK